MTSLSSKRHGVISASAAVVVALLFLVAIAPSGKAEDPSNPEQCSPMDGSLGPNGWAQGAAAPGVGEVSFTLDRVVFDVQEGYTLVGLCVETGDRLDMNNIDAALPVRGATLVTLTKAGPDFPLREATFDTEPTGDQVSCPTVEAPSVSFEDPAYIDRDRAGGEPVSVVAQDGSISVSAHAGTTHIFKDPTAAPGAGDFAVGYYNQTLNWRSTDGGDSWEYVGIAGQNQGPHSVTSTGFSDPDFAMDQGGNLYNVEIDLANVAVFKSNDDGQSYVQANPQSWFGDRPWLTALEEDEVFLYVNLPKAMLKSVDGGVTWVPVTSTPGNASPPINSKAVPDPLNPDNGLIGPEGGNIRGNNQPGDPDFYIGVENDVDVDKPGTPSIAWQKRSTGPLGNTQQFFSSLAADNAGNVYLGAAGGYTGGTDLTPNGQVSFAYHERETGRTNAEKVLIPTPSGDALWPWIIAGDDGRAALVWYQNLEGSPEEFYMYIAVTNNAHGTTVTCSDGSERLIEPRFTVLNASKRAVFVGNICQDGTNCNANSNFKRGDRRLGDFFTVNFDSEGNLFLIGADTTIANPFGGQKPVGNPIFIKQSPNGDRMLEKPRELRPTRCLMGLPLCN